MRFIIISVFYTFICIQSFSQVFLNNQSIVRDVNGKTLSLEQWQSLMNTNEYGIKESITEKGTFQIYKLSLEEKKQQIESSKSLTMTKNGGPMMSPFFKTGEKIQPFSVLDINGQSFNSNELQGKVVVLNFWFVACGPCLKEIPELNQMVEKYKNRNDVIFLAFALDKKEEILKMISKNPFNYHIIPDSKEFIQNNYKVSMYPTHLVLDKEGKVAFHTSGYSPNTVSSIENSILDKLK